MRQVGVSPGAGGSPVADKLATDQSQGALGVSGEAAYAHNDPVHCADLFEMG